MEEVRKVEGLTVEELEAQRVELLPDREEMHVRLFKRNAALSVAVQACASTATAGSLFVIID